LRARLYIDWYPPPDLFNRRDRAQFAPRIPEEPMSEHIHHVTDDTFEPEVLQSQLPVLVDYWAEWCGPCKTVAPIIEEVARDYAGRLKVAKIDIDQYDKMAARFGVRGIPTLMLFRNGAVAAQKVGALSKSQLTAFLDTNI
jgi:thioredoxin 1